MSKLGPGALVSGRIRSIKPEILDKWNADEHIEAYGDDLCVDPRILVPDDAVAETRAGRAKQQQASALAAAMPAAKDAASAANVLSNTNISEDNALTRAMGIGA